MAMTSSSNPTPNHPHSSPGPTPDPSPDPDPDPGQGDDLKFARACRNLQLLQQEGKVRHVGLSNVSYELLVASQGAIEVCAVQNRCNVFDPSAFKDGVVGHHVTELSPLHVT